MVDEGKYAATLEDAKQIAELAGIELSVVEGDEEDLAIDDRPHVDVDAPPSRRWARPRSRLSMRSSPGLSR